MDTFFKWVAVAFFLVAVWGVFSVNDESSGKLLFGAAALSGLLAWFFYRREKKRHGEKK